MKILHLHNQYRCKDPIKTARHYYLSYDKDAVQRFKKYDAVMPEIDICFFMGKVRIMHSKSYNPLTWIGVTEWFFKRLSNMLVYLYEKIHDIKIYKYFLFRRKLYQLRNKGWSGRWHGTPEEFVKQASEAGIKYVMIEAKSYIPVNVLDSTLLKYPHITFVILKGEKCSRNDYTLHNLESWLTGNCISYGDFIAQNDVTTANLYE